MGRPLRIQVANGIYHVTTQSNHRRVVYPSEADRALFLHVFEAVLDKYEWECHAWCLMTTHYHLLIRTREPNIAAGMQLLNGCYARNSNRRHGTPTHVFGDRYYSGLVTSEAHVVATIRYIALNPVAAGICKRAADWEWSSYTQWTRAGSRPPLLAPPLLDELRGPLATEWLRERVEPYEGMAAVVGPRELNGVRHR